MPLSTLPAAGRDLTAFAYEAVTVANTSIGFTTATIAPSGERPASNALVTAETAQMRYRLDGTAPTSSEGHLLEVGDVLEINGISTVSQARFIRTGATSGTIRCTFSRFL